MQGFALFYHPLENQCRQCVQQCGACCHLDIKERPDLKNYLSAAEMELYLSLVGSDGWCIHFDHNTRQCRIYADRPEFCRVTPGVFQRLYGIEAEELDPFAIACCREHIADRYGGHSVESLRFEEAIR